MKAIMVIADGIHRTRIIHLQTKYNQIFPCRWLTREVMLAVPWLYAFTYVLMVTLFNYWCGWEIFCNAMQQVVEARGAKEAQDYLNMFSYNVQT